MAEEIRLRRYDAADAEALHAAAEESVAEVFPWLPWCHPGYSLEEAQQWAASCEQPFVDGREYHFVIVDSIGRFLGACGLNQINPINRFANLGYWVRTSQTGRGVAPAAIRRLATFAFTETDLQRLEIVCAVGNHRSQRAAEKAGAQREGILRARLFLHGQSHDAVMYAIVRHTAPSATSAAISASL